MKMIGGIGKIIGKIVGEELVVEIKKWIEK